MGDERKGRAEILWISQILFESDRANRPGKQYDMRRYIFISPNRHSLADADELIIIGSLLRAQPLHRGDRTSAQD
ncbi:hypothetical protein AB4Z34_28390 [Ensifer sp. 2YAB10]|uniref:hypothetical protein n=1 Tax=unclassified Ensifer TaxID=2633371 RepID=UPI003F92752B